MTAPNLNLTPKDEIKTAEAAENAAYQPTLSERAKLTTDQIRYLEALEAKSVPGAPMRTPKEALLSLDALQARHPDRHFRWGNLNNSAKMEGRIAEGYTILPTEEGGRRLGNEMAVLSISREEYDRRVKSIEKRTEDRLSTFKNDMRSAAEGVARQMRDRYGVNVKINDILVDR